jgi:hypothetical protein
MPGGMDQNRHSVMNHERFTMSENVQCANDADELNEYMDQVLTKRRLCGAGMYICRG